jgi:hypothetical protein
MTADQIWTSPPMSGDIVAEEWIIVDKWWTATPITRKFRTVSRATGHITQMSENDGPWIDYDRYK